MEEKTNIMFGGIALLLYFALKPLYLWNSGMLQVSDILLVLFISVYIFKSRGIFYFNETKTFRICRFIVFLISYQFLVNFIWYIFIQEYSLLKSSVYYIFNTISFIYTVLLVQTCGITHIKKMIARGTVVSVFITLIGMMIYTGTSRATGFFNNPNQLGYYSIIILTVLLYLNEYFSKPERVVVFIGAIISTFSSLSKAAIISAFLLISIYTLINQKDISVKSITLRIGIILLVGIALYWLFYSDSKIIYNNQTLYLTRYRILHMTEENDSNLGEGRGYNRIWELGGHFLWGMGEGAYSRFKVKNNGEVHSTIISLIVSYGLFGFIGYCRFLFTCINRAGKAVRNLALLSGIFFYALSHNGIRNTLIWIILAVLFMEQKETSSETLS